MTRVWWWGAAIAWAGLIFLASTDTGGPGRFAWLDLPFVDKLLHAGVFGILALLLALASGRPLLALVLASAYGVSDELHQLAVPGRSASGLDWLADTVGAGLVAAVVFLWRRPRGQRVE